MILQRHLPKFCFFAICILITSASNATGVECASPSGEILSYHAGLNGTILTYASGRGAEFTPIEDGPVRQISIEFYKMAYEDLKDVLPYFSVKWSTEACKLNSSWWLSACNSGGILISDSENKTKISGLSLSKLSENGSSGDQVIYRFRLSFEKEGNTYFVPLSFSDKLCKVTEN